MRLLPLFLNSLVVGSLAFSSAVANSAAALDKAAEGAMLAAIEANKPYPVLSQHISDFNLDQAYAVQRAVVRQSSLPVVGFKAGLTTQAGQRRFAVAQPIAGVLVKPVLSSGDTLQQRHFHRLMLEPELAFRLQHSITAPIEDIAQLKQFFDAVAPALELPDLGFEVSPRLLGVDVIASNTAANHVAVGVWQPLPAVSDVNALTVQLWRDGQPLRETTTGTVMGDQWRALQWLINHTLAQGYALEPGQIFITGAMGSMLPALVGHYSLRIESLAALELTIAE
jgi:2-keto-4-pentenoate hydratase